MPKPMRPGRFGRLRLKVERKNLRPPNKELALKKAAKLGLTWEDLLELASKMPEARDLRDVESERLYEIGLRAYRMGIRIRKVDVKSIMAEAKRFGLTKDDLIRLGSSTAEGSDYRGYNDRLLELGIAAYKKGKRLPRKIDEAPILKEAAKMGLTKNDLIRLGQESWKSDPREEYTPQILVYGLERAKKLAAKKRKR